MLPSRNRYPVFGRRALRAILSLVLASMLALAAQAQTEVELLPADGAPDDEFGRSVAISGDYAIVGARLDDDNGDRSGSAYIFMRQADGSWVEQVKLLASEGELQDEFGRGVAIFGDTAVVGAPAHNSRGGNSGAAYVFERNGSTWGTNCTASGAQTVCNENVLLLASDRGAGALFGFKVAISGNEILAGAYLAKSDAGNAVGKAYVFERSGSNWGTGCVTSGGRTTCNETVRLLASDAAPSDFLGIDVALDGGVAVAGAFGDDHDVADSGSAYVFERSAGGWGTGCVTSGGLTTCNESLKLLASDGAVDDEFGRGVAVSGNTIVVGADRDDDSGGNSGSAYVFERAGGVWGTGCSAVGGATACRETAKLLAGDGAAADLFGLSVAVDGGTAVVGAIQNGPGGSAYVFERAGGVWGTGCSASGGLAACNESFKLVPGDPTDSVWFGFSVSIDADAVLVGDNRARDNGRDAGAAYVFELDDDEDDDGVEDDRDRCPGTVIPEPVPTVKLNPNHWALADADLDFDTAVKGGKGPERGYTTEDTGGCSCAQIVDALALGAGHLKHGCSNGVMDGWVGAVTSP